MPDPVVPFVDPHATAVARLAVSAGFVRMPVASVWQDSAWRLQWVEQAGLRAAHEPAELPAGALDWRASVAEMPVLRDEAEGYWLNVTAPQPSIFVLWRLDDAGAPAALAATLSYNEAGRWMDAGETVDRVPMPTDMVAWLAEWVGRTYEPQRRKRQRGPKPSFMARDEFERFARGDAPQAAAEPTRPVGHD